MKAITRREIVLMIIAGLALALLITAAGLAGSHLLQDSLETKTIVVDIPDCLTPQCLDATSWLQWMRNESVNPCDDFYQYACSGRPMKIEDLDKDHMEMTTFTKIVDENEEKLRNLLGGDPKRTVSWASERKIILYYKSCLDSYASTVNGGVSFINRILNMAGGWQAINSWNEARYDVSDSMKKVHVEFWRDAIFKIRIAPDPMYSSRNIIEIDLGGLTLWWWEYTYNTSYYQMVHNATKEFMTTVADLVMRDSGQVPDPNERMRRAREFAEDVFTFESMIANTTRFTLPTEDPHDHEKRLKVSELSDFAHLFDWNHLIPSMFNDSGVNENTQVVLLERDFLRKANELIQNLPNQKRTLNNYFSWRLMLGYVTDLGWEYIHANRVFYVARTGLTEFLGVPKYCYNQIKQHFSDALGALFIRDHFAERDRDEVHSMVKYLKRSLNERLNEAEWMEEKSRSIAIDKNKAIVEKLGYPEWMGDNDFLDDRYKSFAVHEDSDYLSNLLALNRFDQKKLNDLLKMGEDKSEWRNQVYSSIGYYDVFWNEILIPAGLLQWPIYGQHMPRYYNYGAFGSYLAKELTHAVDEIGGYYLKNGTYHDWWTKNTTLNYNKRRACLEDLDIKAGPYLDSNGAMRTVPIDGAYVARQITSDVSGIRTGFKAYQDFVMTEGSEKKAPGLNLNNEQTYFLAYAQTQCFVRRDFYSLIRADMRKLPEDVRVNLALSHTPEFVKAFNCPVSTQMHAEKMCEVF